MKSEAVARGHLLAILVDVLSDTLQTSQQVGKLLVGLHLLLQILALQKVLKLVT